MSTIIEKPDISSDYLLAVQEVHNFAKALQRDITNTPVVIEPGHIVRVGQGFRVNVGLSNGYRRTLLVVYVPKEGFPVEVAFTAGTGKMVQAENLKSLNNILYSDVCADKDIQDVLRALIAIETSYQVCKNIP